MSTEFEMVAFEMAEEGAGRRGGAGRGPRPSLMRAWPGRPRAPRWPAWGGWRYPVLAPWPEPAPYPVEDDEPQDEQPASVAPALAKMAGAAPRYERIGPLRDAVARLGPKVAGLYLIEFDGPAGKRAYSGQSDNVRRRLQQHLLCATMLGLEVAKHQVFVAVSASAAARRQTEKDLHDKMGVGQGKGAVGQPVLTNQRKELEAEVLGQFWGQPG